MLLPHFKLRYPSSILVLAVLLVITAARRSRMFQWLMDEKRVTPLCPHWLYVTHAQLHSHFQPWAAEEPSGFSRVEKLSQSQC